MEQACAGDETLRKEIVSLIESHGEAGSFIDAPAADVAADLFAESQRKVVGRTVGPYSIVDLLGTGGMGEVYLALDTRLGRKVALKLLPTQYTRDEDRVRRFIQEAKTASALNHPNIVTIHEIGDAQGTHFIATEFVDGDTLRQCVRDSHMKLNEKVNIAIQTAEALAAAHEAGIVHRDIKPENIMRRRRDGYVKVLDFGLAKLTERQTSTIDTEALTIAKLSTDPGTVMGTVTYMSPEQARGVAVDERSDIFSLGVVIYEMLAGCPPFQGETASDVIASILKTEPAPLASHSSEVSAELQRIVSKALRKDRDERYQSATELLGDLKTVKRQLGFQEEFENSISPESSEPTTTAQTGTGSITPTADVPARTTSSVEYLVNEIIRHKVAALTALALLVLAIVGVSVYFQNEKSAGAIESIAVLPFENQNRDSDMEYRSDGLTESIINSLTQLQNLRVIPRSSVFRYRGRERDPLEVGRELGVRAVLTGRIMQRGDNLSISAELTDVRENKQLWGEHYERRVSDLLPVQRDIAKEISSNLRLRLSGADQSRLAKHYTDNPEAYQLYLKGRFYWNNRTSDSLKKSIEYFNQAIEKDPGYALPYSGLADCYSSLGFSFDIGSLSPSEAIPQAKAAATTALQMDDTLAEAHTSLAFIRLNYDWDWAAAEKEFKRAIELNPNYDNAHHWYSHYLMAMGRTEESLAQSKRALELDQLGLIMNIHLGWHYFYAHQYDLATEQFLKTLEMDPNYGLAHWYLGLTYEQRRMYQEAGTEFERAKELLKDNLIVQADRGHAYAVSGKRDEAQKVIDELKGLSKRRYVSSNVIALIYAGLGEKDRAFEWLESAYSERSDLLVYLKVEPRLDVLRSDARFADLIRRVGLPQ